MDLKDNLPDGQKSMDCEKELKENKLTKGLNPEQKKAVLHDKGPLLILAGAGSGKTRVITHRIAYLVNERKVNPYQILAITFTNKAAKEMKTRIEDLIGENVNSIWVGTFHSMLVRILRKHIEKLGFSPSFTIIDSDEQQRVVKKCIENLNLDEKMYQPRSIHSAISSAKNSLIGVDEFKKEAGGDKRKQKVADIYESYQRHLKENAALDFDDILFYAVKLLKDNPEILEFYRGKFEYILVDEYQDTNHAQYTIIEMLAKKHQNLCVVGDDDQSIYAFRGANIQNILDFEKDFKNCVVIKLEQNYRSTKTVLDAANCVIANNKGRKDKKLWTKADEGELITFIRAENQNDEAKFVVSEIKRIVKTACLSSYSEIAVLYRINALSRNFEGEFLRQGIPYRIYGGMRFFDRKEIKDILAYLRLVVNGDNISFARIINVPRRGIGDVTVENISRIAQDKGISFLEVCEIAKSEPDLSRSWPKLYEFSKLIEELRQVVKENSMSFADLFEYVQEKTGIIEEILAQREKKGEEIDRVENLKELISDAIEFEKQTEIQLEDEEINEIMAADEYADSKFVPRTLEEKLTVYLENTALYTEADKEDGNNDFVKLMTIHSAKGLEFDYVFLAGAEESLFPGMRTIQSGNPEEMEEERRLAYVSITRARKKLYITTTKHRMVFGQTQCLPISRFVKEIPDCYIEEISSGRKVDPFENYHRKQSFENSSTLSEGFIQFNSKSKEKGVSDFEKIKSDLLSTGKGNSSSQGNFLAPNQISEGDFVKHEKFGRGKILQKSPVANDAIVEIAFERFGTKKLMVKMARLTK